MRIINKAYQMSMWLQTSEWFKFF